MTVTVKWMRERMQELEAESKGDWTIRLEVPNTDDGSTVAATGIELPHEKGDKNIVINCLLIF